MFIRTSIDYVYDIVAVSLENVHSVCNKTTHYVKFLLRDEYIIERINLLENSLKEKNELSKQLGNYAKKIEQMEENIRSKLFLLDTKIGDFVENFDEFRDREYKVQTELKLLSKDIQKNTYDIEILKNAMCDSTELNKNIKNRLDNFVSTQKQISEKVEKMQDKNIQLSVKVNNTINYQATRYQATRYVEGYKPISISKLDKIHQYY